MQWLARVCVQRPVFAGVLMLVIFVLGGVGYTRLGLDQFPNIDLPFVIVTTTSLRLGDAPRRLRISASASSRPSCFASTRACSIVCAIACAIASGMFCKIWSPYTDESCRS